WNMSEQKHLIHMLRMKTVDSLVILFTFVLTVYTSLTTAVEIGLLLEVILVTKRISKLLVISKVLPDHTRKHEQLLPHVVNKAQDCPQRSMYTIEVPLF
ncbi:sodium-independent anion transporter, partial [Bacillus paranthracis]|nr:sodium-independent anion transporter [Bacillus paranthracis]